jgi:hypothetical protein
MAERTTCDFIALMEFLLKIVLQAYKTTQQLNVICVMSPVVSEI